MHIKLVYPAQPFLLTEVPRPDGSLGLLYIAGALRDAGFKASLLDVSVGDDNECMSESFYRRTQLDEEIFRIGLSKEAILAKLQDVDVIAVTSIFTMNTNQAFEIASIAKKIDRSPLTVAGGGNARAMCSLFLDNGFEVVVLGEGEKTIVELCNAWERKADLATVPGIAFRNAHGEVVKTDFRSAETNLDKLAMPAWDLLPLEKYWTLGDPPGGCFTAGEKIRYLTMQTSRGCPFCCSYCHISKEGDAANLRLKSDERVLEELEMIKSLNAEHVLLQDDSLLADRNRVIRLLEGFKSSGIGFSNTNGVNVRHFFLGPASCPVLDCELLDTMRESGITDFAIAFESGSRRILNKYASQKWDPTRHDALALVKASRDRGFTTQGFFTIGYPDESLEELNKTFMLAKRLVNEGLQYASFYVVTPYPGTALFDMAVKNGNLPPNLDLSRMKFQIPTLINTVIHPEVIKYSRQLAYKLIHPDERIGFKDNKTIGSGKLTIIKEYVDFRT